MLFAINYTRIRLILSLFIGLTTVQSCTRIDEWQGDDDAVSATIATSVTQLPLIAAEDDRVILEIKLQVDDLQRCAVNIIKISLKGTSDLNDLETIGIFYAGSDKSSTSTAQFGRTVRPASEIIFEDHWVLKEKTAYFKVLAKIKKNVDLLHLIDASCEMVRINDTEVIPETKSPGGALKMGMVIRKHGGDQVHTYRIPGLTTTAKGTLLAVYDVRRESDRDLQGNMDIGLSRSTDGGNTWEPMRIILDKGKWGGLPEKFNGISDACILVDKNTNTIFVAGLWMYGVLNSSGQWVENLSENSGNWNHQWWNRGSQAGFDVKQTSQFLLTKSTDDGQTWSEPVNLTRMCKKESWWLWAPAPGHGITLDDGTLVFPTQGRDEGGVYFSNITWSRDGGQTWKTSNLAGRNSNENMVVQLADGSVMLNARDCKNAANSSNTNGRMIAVTKDLGETWSEYPVSEPLIEPFCMASIHKHDYTENGEKKSILLFSNPNSKIKRDHITIKVSFDEGKTWPEKYWTLLDEGVGRGYSCLTSVDEQTIGIIYEGSQADLMFQKIALSELINK
ncbi:MAG: exo-alpha-sialidase [Prolixibacteraceae bacterium]